MPRFRNSRNFTRTTKTYKKRWGQFNATAANSTPTEIGNIQIAETGTIVSLKISITGIGISPAAGDVQEARLWVRCGRENDAIPDPNDKANSNAPYDDSTMDIINGFTLPSIFLTEFGVFQSMNAVGGYSQKFNFKRKCDRNTILKLETDTIVRNQTARSVAIFGYWEIVIQVK